MEEMIVDVAVIGSGPAGQKAAIQSAKLGKKVIIIDQSPNAGGACLFSGTIPSKTFREAVVNLTRFYERGFRIPSMDLSRISINDLMKHLRKVEEEERHIIYRQLKRNDVQVVQGKARFEDSETLLAVDFEDRVIHRLKADRIIIAAGSNPRHPSDIVFDQEVILDSTTLLGIEKIPKTMLVLGGGIIGSEYASFFAALGVDVIVIDKKSHMLPMLDSEIAVNLQTALRNMGLCFKGNKEPVEVKRIDNHAFVRFKDGSALEADILLYALGRVANVDGLCIEKAGIAKNDKGYLVVNPLFQTTNPKVYAVGDVIGGPCLASTSMEQGRLAALHACIGGAHYFPAFYPVGVYTIPEISSFGYTEQELKALGFHYEVGRAYYYEIAKSSIAGTHVGLLKILFHRETREILGVHIIGRSAAELIHIGQMAIHYHEKIDFFIDQVFNYPTFAEGYRIAALNGLNKIQSSRYNVDKV